MSVLLLLATALLGFTTRLEATALAGPVTKTTSVEAVALLPKLAIIASFCATVEVSVVVAWPLALVVVDCVPKALPVPEAVKLTLSPGTRLLRPSLAVKVSTTADAPSAVTALGLATSTDVADTASPA